MACKYWLGKTPASISSQRPINRANMNLFAIPNFKQMPVRRKVQCICFAHGGMLLVLLVWSSYVSYKTGKKAINKVIVYNVGNIL